VDGHGAYCFASLDTEGVRFVICMKDNAGYSVLERCPVELYETHESVLNESLTAILHAAKGRFGHDVAGSGSEFGGI